MVSNLQINVGFGGVDGPHRVMKVSEGVMSNDCLRNSFHLRIDC